MGVWRGGGLYEPVFPALLRWEKHGNDVGRGANRAIGGWLREEWAPEPMLPKRWDLAGQRHESRGLVWWVRPMLV